MASATLTTNPAAQGAVTLKLNLLSEGSRRLLTSEPVSDADLTDFRSEAWLHCFLRKGRAGVALADARFRLVPLLKSDSDSLCAGFVLESTNPEGLGVRREFAARALGDVARRASDRLLKFGALEPGDRYS